MRALAIDGGVPTRRHPWPSYQLGDVMIDENDVDAVVRAVRSRCLHRYDSRPLEETEVGRFERALCDFFGVPHALAVSSGSTALALGLLAAGVGKGDEVLASAFTYVGTPSSIMLAGATPVLVDVDDNLNMDLHDLRRKCTPRTKAILAVHMRGFGTNIRDILDVAAEMDLPVIEDAVPALGVRLGDRYLGTCGTAGAFSMQANKSLNTGEGGFVLMSSRAVFERAAVLSGAWEDRWRRHCTGWQPQVSALDFPVHNFRLDELRGALGYSQLQKLPGRLARLREIYSQVIDAVRPYPELCAHEAVEPDAVLGQSLLLRIRDTNPHEASWFARALSAEGVSGTHAFGDPDSDNARTFWSWRFMFNGMSKSEIRATLPNTSARLDELVDVRLSPLLVDSDIEDLSTALGKVVEALRARRSASI